MKKFSVVANKDAGIAYVKALEQAGYEYVLEDSKADFMLYDCEHAGSLRGRIEYFVNSKPAFIYPHSPLAYFLWDGHYKPAPVKCNFVIGEAAVKSMQAYGYPHRVEACGWTRCEIKPFKPTSGTKLLFVPARTKGKGRYSNITYQRSTPKAFQFILDNLKYFEHVTVCYVRDFINEEDYKNTGIEFVKTSPSQSLSPTNEMLARIESSDIVISCETVACLSVAVGKPTIAYNARSVPATGNIQAAKYEAYRKYYEFPLTLEEMDIQSILDTRKQSNSRIEQWKEMNIGKPFDKDKFISIIGEYA